MEADDTPGYAARLGYPVALAEALPTFVNGVRPLNKAAAFADAWLERTPVGADLSKVVSHMILDALNQSSLADLTRGYPSLEESRQAVIALHQGVLRGDEPDRKAWKSARLAAVAATDGLAENELFARKAGAVVEAAAWPGTMRSALRDTLHASVALSLKLSLAEIDWTDEDEGCVFRIRDQAEKDGYKAEFEGLARVYAILDADHPELAERFRARVARLEGSFALYEAAGWVAIGFMERAPFAAMQVMEA